MPQRLAIPAILLSLSFFSASSQAATATVVFDWNAMTIQNLTGVSAFNDGVVPTTSALASDLVHVVQNDGNKTVTAAVSAGTSSTVSLTSVKALAGNGYAGGSFARSGDLTFSAPGVAVIFVPYSYSLSALGSTDSATAQIHFGATHVINGTSSTGNYASSFDRVWQVGPGLSESGQGVMQLAISSQGMEALQIHLDSNSTAWAYGNLNPVPAVPEPAHAALLTSGLMLVAAAAYRRRKGGR